MRRARLTGLFVALLLLITVCPAFADTFQWSYTPTSGTDTGGSGTLTATNLGGGEYQITGISGTWDGFSINSLLPSGTCCSSPADDNLLFMNGGPFLDESGVGFSFIAGIFDVNLFYENGYQALSALFFTAPNVAIETSTGNFTVTAPEPGSLMLLGAGLLGLAGATRRKVSKA